MSNFSENEPFPKAAQELRQLVDAMCDGTATPADRDRLQEIFAEDPAAIDYYVALTDMHAQLQWNLRGRHEADEQTASVDDEAAASARPLSPFALRHRMQQLGRKTIRFFAQPTPFSNSVAALVIGVLIATLGYFTVPYYRYISSKPETSQPKHQFVATLTGTYQAEWADSQVGGVVGSHFMVGQQIWLEAGLAEITFSRGDTVLLEGPARIIIGGEDRVDLAAGRLVGRSEGPIKGFTVVTPSAKFIDLGTEYGIHVPSPEIAELFVFAGEVEAQLAGASADGSARRVVRGQGVIVNGASRQISPAEGKANDFASRLPRRTSRPLELANPSFELPAISTPFKDQIDDWTISDNAGVCLFGPEFTQGTPSGRQVAFLNSGTLEQQTNHLLTADTPYRLSVKVGNRPGNLTPNYGLEIWAGGERLTQRTNPQVPLDREFVTVSLDFSVPSGHPAIGQPLKIVLRSYGSLKTATQSIFDEVQLETYQFTNLPGSATEHRPHPQPGPTSP